MPVEEDEEQVDEEDLRETRRRLLEMSQNFRYDPTGKRDPFRSFVVVSSSEKKYVRTEAVTPLQQYDLAQLKLVAVILGLVDGHALVEDASGKGFIVKAGTYMGKRGGRVVKILSDEIIIEEFYIDYFGRQRSEEASIKIQKGEEGESL